MARNAPPPSEALDRNGQPAAAADGTQPADQAPASDMDRIREMSDRLGVEPFLTQHGLPEASLIRDPLLASLAEVDSGRIAILDDGTVLVSELSNPTKLQTISTLLNRAGQRAKLRPTLPQLIRSYGGRDFLEEEQELELADELASQAVSSDISRYFDTLVSDALAMSATDIHIETRDNSCTIRFRVDGRLVVHERAPRRRALSIGYLLFNALARRGAREFVAHRALDAACNIVVSGITVGLRIATAPEARGFDLMIRLLSGAQLELELDSLGYAPIHLQLMREAINLPYGVMLVSGPVGSGKSTSMMSLIKEVDPVRKVVSLEDPVEIVLPNVTHVPVVEHVKGASWRDLLRGLNRWDSNIVITGEVRDDETCVSVQRMATSGRMVLSTLHASNALAIPTRMEDLGANFTMLHDPNFLQLLVNQRLVPALCENCKRPLRSVMDEVDVVTQSHIERKFGDRLDSVYTRTQAGCDQCREGLQGRVLACEVVKVDRSARQFIAGRQQEEWREALLEAGWQDITQHALTKIHAGRLDPMVVKDALPLFEQSALGRTGQFNYAERESVLGGGLQAAKPATSKSGGSGKAAKPAASKSSRAGSGKVAKPAASKSSRAGSGKAAKPARSGK